MNDAIRRTVHIRLACDYAANSYLSEILLLISRKIAIFLYPLCYGWRCPNFAIAISSDNNRNIGQSDNERISIGLG